MQVTQNQNIMNMKYLIIAFITVLSLNSIIVTAQKGSFTTNHINIVVAKELKSPLKDTYIKVLKEEIDKRTGIEPVVTSKLSDDKTNLILCLNTSKKVAGREVPQAKSPGSQANKAEGFHLTVNKTENSIWIVGADERGVLFGIGELLRKAEMKKGAISLTETDMVSAPAYPLRGHQLVSYFQYSCIIWQEFNNLKQVSILFL